MGTKLYELNAYEDYKKAGGDAAFQQLVAAQDLNAVKTGMSMTDRANLVKELAEFNALGGDAALNRLSANKDERIKPWRNRIAEKLRALRDYKLVESDGAEFDQLGGMKKLETAQQDFESFTANTMPARLTVLRKLDNLDKKGGINKFRSLLRAYKAQSTTLWEDLDAGGQKVRTAFAPYAIRKGGIEGITDLDGILDIVTRGA